MDLELLQEAGLIFAGGLILALVLRLLVTRVAGRWLSPERGLLLRRLAFWGVLLATMAATLDHMGVDLSLFLGAAGILTVALGFASQTSASNFISGLFLVGERPFSLGDFVQIGAVSGEVIAVDWLSVKLRTPDNRFVRVPNETTMKSEIVNFTRFEIRRIELQLCFRHEQDLEAVEALLLATCRANPVVLDEPLSFVLFEDFGERGVGLKLCAWTERVGFLEHRTQLAMAVSKALREAGISLAYPHRILLDERTSE